MSQLTVNEFVPVLSLGMWVGVFFIFVARLISFVIRFCIGLFRKIS